MNIRKYFYGLSHNILTARKRRKKFRCNGTANKSEDGDNVNGEPHGNNRRGGIALYDERSDLTEEKHVHQVHAEREFGERGDALRRLLAFNATEQQERAERSTNYIGRAEVPSPFQRGRVYQYARHAFHPKAPAREE